MENRTRIRNIDAEMRTHAVRMTDGSLWREVPRFAIPVAATSILEQLFNVADIAVVGNFTGDLSTRYIAAIGANTPIIGMIVSLLIGISLGANVVIANALGRKDAHTVQNAVHTSVTASFIGGMLAAVIGELFAEPLLSLLNIPEEVFPYALTYLRIYLIGLPVILLYNFESAIYRSRGQTKLPLAALVVAGVLNVGANLFFVIVLNLGVTGVAIATVLSNVLSSAFLLYMLIRSKDEVRVHIRQLKIDGESLRIIMKIGLPAGMLGALFSIVDISVQSAVNSLGTNIMAASSSSFNIEILCHHFVAAFSQSCTTFVAQNHGAEKIERCRKALVVCMVETAVFLMISTALVGFFGRELIGLFDHTPEVVENGYLRMLIVFVAYAFCVLYENMDGYLRGFGFSFAPAVITAIGVCGTTLIWIWAVFPAYGTFMCLMLCYPVSRAVTAFMMTVCLMVKRPAQKYTTGALKS